MKRVIFAPLALVLCLSGLPAQASWISPFISEIHYDNRGVDVDEFVAVTMPHGVDPEGWQLVLYNGANGQPYKRTLLSGMPGGGGSGWTEYFWSVANIQNGPDAVALVSPSDAVIDLIAYEVGASAFSHIASETVGRRLPVEENGATLIGRSLQRTGGADAWEWIAAEATPGVLNPGLTGLAAGRVPVFPVALLWLVGLAGWLLARSGRGREARPIDSAVAALASEPGPVPKWQDCS